MKVGDLVRNVHAVRTNHVVNAVRDWEPIEAGYVGIVVAVRETTLNACYHPDGKGDVYVDVVLAANGNMVRCGNYHSRIFEVLNNESR